MNVHSRSCAIREHRFTPERALARALAPAIPAILAVLTVVTVALAIAPTVAMADRVVVTRTTGPESPERLAELEAAIGRAVTAAGHEVVREEAAAEAAEAPTTAAELRAVAELHHATYVVSPHVRPLGAMYRLVLKVGYAPAERAEELEVSVLRSAEDARLADIMRAMLRAEGVGDDAVRLVEADQAVEAAAETEQPDAGDDAAARAEAERLARQEQARRELAAREQARRAAAREAAQNRWRDRERYADDRRFMLNAGVDLRPIITSDERTSGGVLGGLSVRGGMALPMIARGVEVRGGVDLVSGAASGFGLFGGFVHLMSFFERAPVFIGYGVEAGLFQATSGNRVPSLMVRGGPVAAYRVKDSIHLEVALPELMFLSANGGVLTLGLSVRGGLRF